MNTFVTCYNELIMHYTVSYIYLELLAYVNALQFIARLWSIRLFIIRRMYPNASHFCNT